MTPSGTGQRHRRGSCGARFDDPGGTVLAGHHQPLRLWVLCLYFMGLNLSNGQIAGELGLNGSDTRIVASQLREGPTAKAPEGALEGVVGIDEVHVVAGHKGNPSWEDREREDELLDRTLALRAMTLPGFLARARLLGLHEPEWVKPKNILRDGGSNNERMAGALIRDMLAMGA